MDEISLALSGGAARGAYHLGVLKYLDEKSIKVKSICATSIGSVIGTSYAAGVSPERQLEIFKSREFRDIFSFNFFRGSIFGIDHKAAILRELLPVDNLDELSIPVYFTVVELNSGKELYYSRGKVPEICIASSALIPLFAPIEYNGLLLADGGIVNHMPIEPLAKYGHPIIGVDLNPIAQNETKYNIFSFLKRSLYIKAFSNSQESQNRCDVFITNDKLIEYSLFSFKHLDVLFELGYQDAVKFLGNYDKII